MLSCYVIAHTLWVAVAGDAPVTINVDTINAIRPYPGYADSFTLIDSGYRSAVSIPIAYPDFMIQFNACLTEAQYQE